jgi:uncharacterized protein YfcZ (UPF0381/DUF406 family)
MLLLCVIFWSPPPRSRLEEVNAEIQSTRAEMEGALGSLRRQIEEARAETVSIQREVLQVTRRLEAELRDFWVGF